MLRGRRSRLRRRSVFSPRFVPTLFPLPVDSEEVLPRVEVRVLHESAREGATSPVERDVRAQGGGKVAERGEEARDGADARKAFRSARIRSNARSVGL